MKRNIFILSLVILSPIIIILGIIVGSADISFSECVMIFISKLFNTPLPSDISNISSSIVINIRLPRVLMAFITGAALAVSGAVMQSIMRNTLASSYTLGVSSGASLMAAIVIVFGVNLPVLGKYTLPFMGFIGGLVTVILAMLISKKLDKSMQNTTIILVGMVLSLFTNGILTLITTFSADKLGQLVFWQMGSFSGQNFNNIKLLLPIVIICILIILLYSVELDILTFGDEQASATGINVPKVKFILITLSALLTGVCVAFTGVIGFIDLIAAHIVRKFLGAKHKYVIITSALLGGIFLVVADMISRTILSPRELPVGAVTALVGAPFFIYVYFSSKKESIDD